MRYLFIVVLMFISTALVYGQEDEVLHFGTTEKTDEEATYDSKGKHKEKKVLLLVRTDPRRVLDGNKCFKEYQQSIGVRVAKLEKGEPGNYNDMSRFAHNLGVRVRGTFRNGPFWVWKMNRKLKECKAQLHDFLG